MATNRRLRLDNGMSVPWEEAAELNKNFAKENKIDPFNLARHNREGGLPIQLWEAMKSLAPEPPVGMVFAETEGIER